MLVCANCGQENPDVARFCLACGATLIDSGMAREERKVVTVLFADLVGFTSRAEQLDPEDVRAMLSPYYARLRTELERRGGTVEKFIGDAVMALFGAPVAHEDDPERAVRAALAIRDAIGELNESDPKLELQVRIAVNTGEALVALGAQPSEGEGMASGDVVNTAARLQASAPVNGILVGETTYRATERTIEYREAPPVTAKGKAETVKVWEALEPRARYGVDIGLRGRVPLVGREQELDVLLDALARVRAEGASQLVTLVGVPGIGKSRLVVELSAIIDEQPELIFWRQGRSLPYGEGVTFWALAEIVKAQAGILETDSAEAAVQKLGQTVEDVVADEAEADWIESQLRPLVGLEDEAQPGADRQAEAFGAWRRFFERLAEKSPLVLVFEDLHWADDGLLDFVDDLVEWASGVPLLVVCIARPELLTRRPGWGGGKPNATTLSLSPLTREDTARLVAALLEQAVLPADLQASLLARAEGNPLYAEEYVRMLQDRGFLRRDDGAWRFEGSDDLPLPESVQGIVAARLDSLSHEEKTLAQDAAVIGKVFWAGAVAAVGGKERGAIEEWLHALSRKEFVRRERRSSVAGEEQYIFLHVLVRDVAYGQIPRGSRSSKHRAAAEWIASLSADRSEDRAEMLAHHYMSALELAQAAGEDTGGFAEPARMAFREAGDRALSLNAFSAASRFYSAALELWPADEQERPNLLLRLGLARYKGEATGAEILEEARDGLLAAGDFEAAAEAEVHLGNIRGTQGLRDLEAEHIERAAKLLDGIPASKSKVYTLTQLAGSSMMAGRYEDAIRAGRDALEMADKFGLDESRSHALSSIGISRMNLGDSEGISDLERSLAVALENNLPESTSRGYGNLAEMVSSHLGDLGRSFELRAEGRRVAERFGLAPMIRFLRGELVVECYWTGRWDEGLELADEFLSETEAGSPNYMDSQCLLAKARIGVARSSAAAFGDAEKALEIARIVRDPQALYPALAFRARAEVAAHRLDEAGRLADELLTLWARKPETMLDSHLQAFIDVAIVLGALGRGSELIEISGKAKLPTKWIDAAKAFVLDDFQRAAEIYAEIGSLPDEALARLRAAEALLADGRRAEGDQELQKALSFYRSAGATAYLREGETLLARTA
ncbi:MAG TPA: adenylate/guanylate cyclase domain-containing protein [Gaiellaceae bacterium]|jgi:class 3 adenylate cyclase/tetratricopeptide (TPR) repeat protein